MIRAMRAPILVLAGVVLVGCSSSQADGTTPETPARSVEAEAGPDPVSLEGTEVGYFAGGCFWGVEHYMQQLDGVVTVESGFMGGTVESPTYKQVTSKTSGHLETVRVRFDPTRVDYEAVAQRFFEIHDPTQADGQGPDLGPQYLSAVFYTDDAQKKANERLIAQLVERGYDVVTELHAAGKFWQAEGYHQDYYAKSGKKPYCHARVERFSD
jgi:peptide methionine sulfoxide reductase msrA/msrB